jgi:hypothetical protein
MLRRGPAQPYGTRGELLEYRNGAAEMIAVRVRDHEDIEAKMPERTKGGGDDPVPDVKRVVTKPARIDQHGQTVRTSDQEGIPLPHIEHHELQPARSDRPPPVRNGQGDRRDHA